jgi:hypothetical protein
MRDTLITVEILKNYGFAKKDSSYSIRAESEKQSILILTEADSGFNVFLKTKTGENSYCDSIKYLHELQDVLKTTNAFIHQTI